MQLRDDDTVRAVIITGAEGVFCAGADITAFDALRAEPLLGDRAAAGGHFWSELERFPSPSSQRWKSSRWAAAQN